MEFQWDKKNKDLGVSDKEVLGNPRAYHSYTVEGAIARILLEMTTLNDQFYTMSLAHIEEVKKLRVELADYKKLQSKK